MNGMRYGRLLVLCAAGHNGRALQWLCLCDCGRKTYVRGADMRQGKHLSCGCLQSERASAANGKHRGCSTKIYFVWGSMIGRCHNPKNKSYPRYGGRGITVCDRWRNSFEAFRHDMGARPSDQHSIERKDNSLGYDPSNCCWATTTQQSNNRRNVKRYQYGGRDGTARDMSQWFNVPFKILRNRLGSLKWPIERAISQPYIRTKGASE